MQYLVHKPGPPVSDCVEYLWFLSDAAPHARERIFPSGTLELVVNLAQDEFCIYDPHQTPGASRKLPGAIVSGCYSAPFEFDTRAHAAVMGVHFKPGCAAGVIGAPAGELTNLHVGLQELWGARATELRERLCSAPSAAVRFRVLEQVLSAAYGVRRQPRAAVKQALQAFERPGVEIGALVRTLGMSRRRFIEIFTQDVGMTPKRYARVRRFQRALAAATASPAPSWTELALEYGYFDQAHLCREWGELTHVSPSEFVKLGQQPVKDNHLALTGRG